MSTTTTRDIDDGLAELVTPVGGVVASLERLAPAPGRGEQAVTRARLGEVGALRAGAACRFGAELDGIGCHEDPAVSTRMALMEALERYAAAVGDERRWLTGSAVDLGPDAIDLGGAARCSESERRAPGFPLARWDPRRPLRWARGWSLVDGREVWAPAVMTHLGVAPRDEAERFWLQTSSGCAAGETLEHALLAACLELIERDAVAIAWLQRLALPRIDVADPGRCRPRPECGAHGGWGWDGVAATLSADVDRDRIALYDATSDLGVPTVLALLAPAPGSGLPTVAGAACSDSGSVAARKALRELTIVRACGRAAGAPDRPPVPEEAFAQLRSAGAQPCPAGSGAGAEFIGTTAQRLARVVSILARASREVVAVELTPVELQGRGVRVVRVLAPALLPVLAHPAVRYLASERLYDAPRRMGHRVLPEEEVNPWPSPLW